MNEPVYALCIEDAPDLPPDWRGARVIGSNVFDLMRFAECTFPGFRRLIFRLEVADFEGDDVCTFPSGISILESRLHPSLIEDAVVVMIHDGSGDREHLTSASPRAPEGGAR